MKKFLGIVALLIVPALAVGEMEALEEWLENERQRWEIPGMAVAVVHEGQVVLARGFGETRMHDGRPVDADTQFGIASLSKAMTATALAMLVDEGKLNWDDRVVDHLPEFELSDPWVTAEVTIRDLLSHRVGVGRLLGNRLTFMPAVSRDEFIARLRHHEFELPFREGYVYSNAMYTVAGAVLEAVSGLAWEDFLETRLFSLLGMTRSNARIGSLDDNAVWPHQEIEGELVEIPRRNWGFAGPAAAVNASVHDLARWMLFNLGESGTLDGERLVEPEVMAELYKPVSLVGLGDDGLSINAYGLGWGISRYRGLRVLSHGGATDGINSQLWLIPELELGVVISANRFTHLRPAAMRRVVDHFAGHSPSEWGEKEWKDFQKDRDKARLAREEVHQSRQEGTSTTRELSVYTGIYSHPLYDQVEVLETDDGLSLRFWSDDSQVAHLEHWHFDTFRAHWKNRAQREKFVWFGLDSDGQPTELNVQFTLRPRLLEEGIYPADYTREVRFVR
jgi:CubicO group peptidase (beta-lactamase class C family)